MQEALDSVPGIPGLHSGFDWKKHAWLLFEARLAAVTGDGDRAAHLLREAITNGDPRDARVAGAVGSFENAYMHDAVWTRIRSNRSYQAVLRGDW